MTAAGVIAPKHPERWRRKQQERLLENKVSVVLRSLSLHLEAENTQPVPVRAARQYLSERKEHLDYAGARAAGLEIKSKGDIGM